MKKILEALEQELKAAFTACGYEEKFAKVVLSNRPDLCEYQCNGALAAAKQYQCAGQHLHRGPGGRPPSTFLLRSVELLKC